MNKATSGIWKHKEAIDIDAMLAEEFSDMAFLTDDYIRNRLKEIGIGVIEVLLNSPSFTIYRIRVTGECYKISKDGRVFYEKFEHYTKNNPIQNETQSYGKPDLPFTISFNNDNNTLHYHKNPNFSIDYNVDSNGEVHWADHTKLDDPMYISILKKGMHFIRRNTIIN